MKQIKKKAIIDHIKRNEAFTWMMLEKMEELLKADPSNNDARHFELMWRSKWATYYDLIKVINGQREVSTWEINGKV